MTAYEISDLVGLAEVAEMYGLTKSGASSLVRGYEFPRPVRTLKMGPIWSRTEVSEACRDREPVKRCIHCDSAAIVAFSDSESGTDHFECQNCDKKTTITISCFPDPKYIVKREVFTK